MEDNRTELELEKSRLEQTIALAKKQLDQARERNVENKSAIISAKKELRENTSHSIANLWSSEGFEALAALNQYANPITDKIADYEAVENKILLLEKMIQSPYFARIDLKFDDEDEFENIYIGRTSLKKDETNEFFIYDWRSPIASVFYRFVLGQVFYDAPGGRITGEVNLKRQYEISKGELEYFFDADVQIVDEFLRKLLSQNTSPKMKTIVETIQRDQDIVIRDMENDLMMVQGVAGSGKTSIALHRAAYLMYQGLSSKLTADNILIISPNSLFEQYISNVLPELGEEHVVSVVFEDIIASVLKNEQVQSRNQFLENLISNTQYRDIIKSCIEFKTSRQFLEILDRFIDDLPHKWMNFEDIFYGGECIISGEMIKEKVLSGINETPLGMRLKLIGEYILGLISESKKYRLKQSEKIQMNEEMLKFMELDIKDVYRKLFHDKEYFYSLAKGIELPGCMDRILTFTQENLDTNMLYYDDAAVLTYLNLKIYGINKYKTIKQVVIDEAQDYYPLHFEIFHLLFSKAKFTILGDINQTLEKREDLSLYQLIRKIFNKKKSSLVTMDKSFRCTNEILNYGLKFLEQSTEIKSFNRKGDEPLLYAAKDQTSYHDLIVSEVNSCLEMGYQSIGLICKTEKSARFLFECLKDKADVQLINSESTTDLQGVFIIPVYMSKGLEFDAVLICDADAETYHSQDDKKLLYIACTRALHRLNLFCKGDTSPLLDERKL
ncbi:HelD family protein [Lacrimispora celerecrescens]|uniref:DNA helicase-2/ATP-dependent DNA helicase PcrA n=1 Tax=[Clostridium] celerecrescens 18A TaxID=1286362 RepID=A0A2M8ZBK8_9FIRM|nr:3'-5' exonuclease [Lacrimispora celerecrescens]PJJ30817.1 DNA helicase-2/ATP-dependent DNA helicase PcrA [[Clostridium] celerecrescens 18A]